MNLIMKLSKLLWWDFCNLRESLMCNLMGSLKNSSQPSRMFIVHHLSFLHVTYTFLLCWWNRTDSCKQLFCIDVIFTAFDGIPDLSVWSEHEPRHVSSKYSSVSYITTAVLFFLFIFLFLKKILPASFIHPNKKKS